RLDSMYRAKWKNLGMMVYSVNVNEAKMPEFKQFIAEKAISKDWVQAYQNKKSRDEEAAAGLPNYRQLYDVYKTPTMYLLDEKKQIIAKQLTIEQFDEILTVKLKKENKTK
ncbi:MAG: peroxiredoxin family protein, partial [Chitinophagaceae bacterium]